MIQSMEVVMEQKRMIAFDVGGTKTDAVLFRQDGTVEKHIIAPGYNPLDMGFAAASSGIEDVLKTLCAEVSGPIAAIYGGVACVEYFGDRMQEYLRAHIPAEHIRIEGDGPCLISAMLGHCDGACMICGTGSALYVRKGDDYDHIGGWGYLIDSCGSGFILGKKAVLAAIRAHDGRGEKTLLTDLLHQKCGEDITAHFETLYGRGRAYIASFAATVFEAARRGDSVAQEIVDSCVADLNEMVQAAGRRFTEPFNLVLNGGIFRHFPEYVAALKALAPTHARMIDSDAPPVFGGAVEAMWDAQCACDADFKLRFMAGYENG